MPAPMTKTLVGQWWYVVLYAHTVCACAVGVCVCVQRTDSNCIRSLTVRPYRTQIDIIVPLACFIVGVPVLVTVLSDNKTCVYRGQLRMNYANKYMCFTSSVRACVRAAARAGTREHMHTRTNTRCTCVFARRSVHPIPTS